MNRNPKDLERYSSSERANHWAVGISFMFHGMWVSQEALENGRYSVSRTS